MELGLALPNSGPTSSVERLVTAATVGEELGFSALWVLDHVLVPSSYRERYGRVFEALSVLAYLAARTSRPKLGVSVIVLPMRNPAVVAKEVATIDQLSGGRLILGLGAGYLEEEFANLGADFHTRGRRLDEAIALFRHLFAGREEPFQGRFYGYQDGLFDPLPLQGAQLPILVGGRSDAALRRAARLGDIWQSSPVALDEWKALVERLRGFEGGRRLEVGARVALSGSPDEMWATVRTWQAAGADHLALSFGPAEGFEARMREFAGAHSLQTV